MVRTSTKGATATARCSKVARDRLAIPRQIEQGNGEAQETTRDFSSDLESSLILVLGIACRLPSDDISLAKRETFALVIRYRDNASARFGRGFFYRLRRPNPDLAYPFAPSKSMDARLP
jgi:hypothetical protein